MNNDVAKRWAAGDRAGVLFWCPGCNETHVVTTEAPDRPKWGFSGNYEKPTFTPSVKVTYPANPDALEEFKEWRTERICHSFVTDGMIQFLGDCTHEKRNQTVPLPLLSTWRSE